MRTAEEEAMDDDIEEEREARNKTLPPLEKDKPKKMGLWRYRDIEGGKYLVTRRDGSIPEWPNFVLGARDPAAPAALVAYANKCEKLKMCEEYVEDIRELAEEFATYRKNNSQSEPDNGPERVDDPATVAKMRGA